MAATPSPTITCAVGTAKAPANHILVGGTAVVTIQPSPISIIADSYTIPVGWPRPASYYTVTGLIGNDTLDSVIACSLSGGCAIECGDNLIGKTLSVGTYPIVCSGNYYFQTSKNPNYTAASLVNGTLTVTPFTASAGVGTAIASLNPAVVTAGTGNLLLQVTGTNFTANSVVWWNNYALPTVFVDKASLNAVVDASYLVSAGKQSITVSTPGARDSAPFYLMVDPASGASVSASITALQVPRGGATSTVLTIKPPLGKPLGTVTVSCLNLPSGANCSFDSSTNKLTITTSNTTAAGEYQVTIVVRYGSALAMLRQAPIFWASLLPPLGLSLAMAGRGRRLKQKRLSLAVLLAMVFLFGLISCGGSGTSPAATDQASLPVAVSIQ